jgi:hypothetical protein
MTIVYTAPGSDGDTGSAGGFAPIAAPREGDGVDIDDDCCGSPLLLVLEALFSGARRALCALRWPRIPPDEAPASAPAPAAVVLS